MIVPFASSAPSVMFPSVRITGSTRLPSGMRATLLKRKMADSNDLKNNRAPAKKKLPALQPDPVRPLAKQSDYLRSLLIYAIEKIS